MKLYEISDQLNFITASLDCETDEPIDKESLTKQLNELQLEFKVKVENIAKIILDYDANLDATTKELTRLTNRKRSLENKIEWLKNYLLEQMQATGNDKIQGEILNVSIAKSPKSVVILDKDKVPKEFRRAIPETWEIDKHSILENFEKTGEIPEGTDVITDKKNVRIR